MVVTAASDVVDMLEGEAAPAMSELADDSRAENLPRAIARLRARDFRYRGRT